VTEDPDAFVARIAHQIRDLRKASGVTGEELAERLGIPVQNVRRIEKGQNITLRTLAKIAAALGANVEVTFAPIKDHKPAKKRG
jgi:transcriptional regulator with XRE-family HTH domain